VDDLVEEQLARRMALEEVVEVQAPEVVMEVQLVEPIPRADLHVGDRAVTTPGDDRERPSAFPGLSLGLLGRHGLDRLGELVVPPGAVGVGKALAHQL
jgi:hypothetical protein